MYAHEFIKLHVCKELELWKLVLEKISLHVGEFQCPQMLLGIPLHIQLTCTLLASPLPPHLNAVLTFHIMTLMGGGPHCLKNAPVVVIVQTFR